MDITLWHIIIPPLIMSVSVITVIVLFRRVRKREAQQQNISACTANDSISMRGGVENSGADAAVAVSISQESVKEVMAPPKGDAHIVEQVAEREKMLIKRIAADPRDVEAYDLLGQVYLVQGNLRDAAECFNQVIAFDPHNLRAVEQLNKIKKIVQDSEDFE